MLAAGIGSIALGLFTTLGESVKIINNALNLYSPVGALSGKTIASILIWLISWTILNSRWKAREVRFGKVFAITLVLIAMGLLGTFPPFFDLFGG